ncbi:hypothetical protein B0H19DRAFT_1060227 [Mycena capillaripes]|nr:hypothetical protein B0H19DRAFT_1060227 [Mycena capillaripes]
MVPAWLCRPWAEYGTSASSGRVAQTGTFGKDDLVDVQVTILEVSKKLATCVRLTQTIKSVAGNPSAVGFTQFGSQPGRQFLPFLASIPYSLPMVEQASDLTAREIKLYRKFILSEEYQTRSFLTLKTSEAWINPIVGPRNMHAESTPASSRAPSHAASSASMALSRTSSPVSRVPPSRGSSPISHAPSDLPPSAPSSRASSPVYSRQSRPPSAMSAVIEISNSENDDVLAAASRVGSTPSAPRALPKVEESPPFFSAGNIPAESLFLSATNSAKGKRKCQGSDQIQITRGTDLGTPPSSYSTVRAQPIS